MFSKYIVYMSVYNLGVLQGWVCLIPCGGTLLTADDMKHAVREAPIDGGGYSPLKAHHCDLNWYISVYTQFMCSILYTVGCI